MKDKPVIIVDEWHRIAEVVIERASILKHGKSKPITPWRIAWMDNLRVKKGEWGHGDNDPKRARFDL